MKAIAPRQIKTVGPGLHRIQGTAGLFVLVSGKAGRSYVWRARIHGRDIRRGLGSVIDTTLTDARNAAVKLKAAMLNGCNDAPRKARVPAARTWSMAFDHLMRTREIRPTTARDYRSTWKHLAGPLGNANVAGTERKEIVDLLSGFKGSVPLKARRLLSLLGGQAVSLGWTNINPADGQLNAALPKIARTKAETPGRKMMSLDRIAPWFAGLRDSIPADCLRLMVLCAFRPADVFGLRWDEVDLDAGLISFPADRRKEGMPFRQPLSDAARAVIERQPGDREGLVFEGRDAGRPVAPQTARNHGLPSGADLHGFRASFATWCAERGESETVRETCLAHRVGTRVERSYQRSDLLDQRRAVLNRWAAFVTGAE